MLRWLWWLVWLPVFLPWRLVQTLLLRWFPRSLLEVRLHGSLADVAQKSVWSSGDTLLSLLLTLQRAERDVHLRQVLLHLERGGVGLAQAEELRQALLRLRQAGKQVTVYADSYGLAAYWIALAANRVVLCPVGSLDVAGVASEFTLLRGLLDKAGVRAQLAARGRYKSMREMFTEYEVSPANREMLESLVADLYQALVERIAQARGKSSSHVEALLDDGPFTAKAALSAGLVDELGYWADLRDELKTQKLRSVRPKQYLKLKSRRWWPVRAARIAVLEVQGGIRSGKDSVGATGQRSTGSDSFVASVQRVAEDPTIRAVVLRVNSPGGSALASDLMWRALVKLSHDKPLVVSMGDVAGSGGYYVSGIAGARIFASAVTLTGSIGVVGGKWDGAELMHKLGIQRTLVQRGRHAAYHSPTASWGEEELAKLQRDIDTLYEDFVRKMAEGRGKSFEELEAVAQGRVWTGAQASTRGLVDELGGLTAALGHVRTQLGLNAEQPLALVPATRPGLLRLLQNRLEPDELMGLKLPPFATQLLALRHERLWCRMPFDLELF